MNWTKVDSSFCESEIARIKADIEKYSQKMTPWHQARVRNLKSELEVAEGMLDYCRKQDEGKTNGTSED